VCVCVYVCLWCVLYVLVWADDACACTQECMHVCVACVQVRAFHPCTLLLLNDGFCRRPLALWHICEARATRQGVSACSIFAGQRVHCRDAAIAGRLASLTLTVQQACAPRLAPFFSCNAELRGENKCQVGASQVLVSIGFPRLRSHWMAGTKSLTRSPILPPAACAGDGCGSVCGGLQRGLVTAKRVPMYDSGVHISDPYLALPARLHAHVGPPFAHTPPLQVCALE